MDAKERAKLKLIEYLSDPNNPILPRTELSTKVLGWKSKNQLNCTFTSAELNVIETEAVKLRKERSSLVVATIYDAMYKQAKKGNVAAGKELLDRYEGKVTDKLDVNADVNSTMTLRDDELDSKISELQDKLNGNE